LGATNPVWLDCDGDGSFTFPNEYAKQLVEKTKGDLEKMVNVLSGYDQAITAQVAGILSAGGIKLDGKEAKAQWEKASSESVRRGFALFVATLKK
jgi:hypothetical protein